MAESNVTQSTPTHGDIDREALRDYCKQIRYALHIGLASFGEIEAVLNDFRICEMTNTPTGVTEPKHPTGAADTIGCFAEALRLLDILEDAPLAV